MYEMVIDVLNNPEKGLHDVVTSIERKEKQLDLLQKEISDFLTSVSQTTLTNEESTQVSGLLHMVNDLERIGDHCVSMLKLARRKYDNGILFNEKVMKQMREIARYAEMALTHIERNYDHPSGNDFFTSAELNENEIDRLRKVMKKEHIAQINRGDIRVDAGLIFIDLLNNLERIGDHAFNIAEILSGRRV